MAAAAVGCLAADSRMGRGVGSLWLGATYADLRRMIRGRLSSPANRLGIRARYPLARQAPVTNAAFWNRFAEVFYESARGLRGSRGSGNWSRIGSWRFPMCLGIIGSSDAICGLPASEAYGLVGGPPRISNIPQVTVGAGGAMSDLIQGPTDSLAKIPKPVWVAPLVFLILALGDWPYGYFMLLRLVVCSAATWLAYSLLHGPSFRGLGWAFVGLALLYNPVFKVGFERDTWTVLNLFSAIPFALIGWKGTQRSRVRRASNEPHNPQPPELTPSAISQQRHPESLARENKYKTQTAIIYGAILIGIILIFSVAVGSASGF